MENVLTKILTTIEYTKITKIVKKDVILEQLVRFAELINESIVANKKSELSNPYARELYARYVTGKEEFKIDRSSVPITIPI